MPVGGFPGLTILLGPTALTKPFGEDIVGTEPTFEEIVDMPFPGFTALLEAMLFMKPFGVDIVGVAPIADETAEMLGGIPAFPKLLPGALLVGPLDAVKAGTELRVGGVTIVFVLGGIQTIASKCERTIEIPRVR